MHFDFQDIDYGILLQIYATNTKIQEVKKLFTDILESGAWTLCSSVCISCSDPLQLFQTPFKHRSLSYSLHPSQLLSSFKSPHLPHCSLLVSPSTASLPFVAPCSPDSTNYWGASTCSGAQQGSHAARKQNFTSLQLSHCTCGYEAERLWHISRMPRKLICASPAPWHRLNPISHFIVSLSCVLGHTHTHNLVLLSLWGPSLT